MNRQINQEKQPLSKTFWLISRLAVLIKVVLIYVSVQSRNPAKRVLPRQNAKCRHKSAVRVLPEIKSRQNAKCRRNSAFRVLPDIESRQNAKCKSSSIKTDHVSKHSILPSTSKHSIDVSKYSMVLDRWVKMHEIVLYRVLI